MFLKKLIHFFLFVQFVDISLFTVFSLLKKKFLYYWLLFLLFHLLFYLVSLSFLLDAYLYSSWPQVYRFCSSLQKKPNSWFYGFSYFFKSQLYLLPLWTLFPSFCWLYVLLVLLFLVPLVGRLRCLRIFWFLRKASISMNFSLKTAFAVSYRFCMVVFSLSFGSRHF